MLIIHFARFRLPGNLLKTKKMCSLFSWQHVISYLFIFVFIATHSLTAELCVDCFVEICMGGTLRNRMSYFKILSMKCIKLAQKTPGAKISAF
jgi:hypothetical protein